MNHQTSVPLGLSVIITTFNRPDLLKTNLASLIPELQVGAPAWEILVAIDQADTLTPEDQLRADSRIRVVRGHRPGASSSRNASLEACRGEIILFLQDDIFLQADCLEHHLAFHARYPADECVFQGLVIYDPTERNAFMAWLETGAQNDFLRYASGFDTGVRWEAANSSMKRAFIASNRLAFNESYRVFENLDLELRATGCGARLFYDKDARAFHKHPITLAQYRNRMIEIGRFQRAYWVQGHLENPQLAPFVPRSISSWTRWTDWLVLKLFGRLDPARLPIPIRNHVWHTQLTVFRMEGAEKDTRA
jgi:glycosyltransferase involved in cell wall biosynthesis